MKTFFEHQHATNLCKFFEVYVFNMGSILVSMGIDANSKILNYATTLCVVMLWVNDSIACFSCPKRARLLYTSALAAPQKKKSRGARSGLCRDHSSSACKLQILFPNNVHKWAIVACVVWGVVPSCWNHSNLFWFGVYSC